MKKFLPLLLILISSIFIFSCKDDNDDNNYVDNDTYSAVYDLKNVNFAYNATDGWNIYKPFNYDLYDSDVVLIYRQTGVTSDGSPIWQSIPRTLYLTINNTAQELDYDFDFSKHDFFIYAGGTYDLSTTPQYLNNQTFRVVLVPASFGGKSANAGDLSKLTYEEVIAKYKIDVSKVKSL